MATRMGILLRVSSAVPAQIIAAVWGASVLSHGGKTQRWRTRPTADKVHPTGPKTPARGHSVRCVEHTGGRTHLCWRVQHHSQVLENILDRRRAILAIRARHRCKDPLPEPHCPKSGHELFIYVSSEVFAACKYACKVPWASSFITSRRILYLPRILSYDALLGKGRTTRPIRTRTSRALCV